jgi:hypothetical protein
MATDPLYALAHHAGRSAGISDAETAVWFRSLCDTSQQQTAGFVDGLGAVRDAAPEWPACALTAVLL